MIKNFKTPRKTWNCRRSFSIGLYLFDKTLDHFEDTEKTYYSLINRTAISVAKKIIQDADKITTRDQKNEEILLADVENLFI